MMTGAQLLARVRKHTDDIAEPYYTSDEDMYLYISEAERELAVAGKLLRDIRNYKVAAGTRWLNLRTEPELLEFRTAVLIDSGNRRWEMQLRGGMDLPPAIRSYYDDFGALAASSQLIPGRPQVLAFGKRTDIIELLPMADYDYTIEAAVILYPDSPIAKASDVPVIPERHHPAIAIGAALLSLDAMEHELAAPKIQSLEIAWQRALLRASEEAGHINRDAAPVQFINDMWA